MMLCFNEATTTEISTLSRHDALPISRRDILEGIFGPLHEQLADLESASLRSSLAHAVSPRGRTGWAKVDEEVAELRRPFQRSEEHTSELQSRQYLVCRLLLEKNISLH